MLIDISKGWKYREGFSSDGNVIPFDADDIDLPADLLRRKNRNYNTALGIYGSYYDGVAAEFYKVLPRVDKCEKIMLEVEGAAQFADVVLNGVTLGHIEGGGKHFVDITAGYSFSAKNLLTLKVCAPQMAGRYVGAGICGGVRLHTYSSGVAIGADGVYVTTEFVNGKAGLTVTAEITDYTGACTAAKKPLTLEATVFNARGKKTARKFKKVKLKNVCVNSCELKFRLARYYTWTVDDPYLYSIEIALKDDGGKTLDVHRRKYGISSRSLSRQRGLVLCGRSVKLRGAVMTLDNGILGAESIPAAEEYKLSRLKSIGYNAVRYAGVPCEAALDALDRVGLMAEIDLFGVWEQGKFPYDGHVRFAENFAADCERYVCQLRKHPSVVLYGLNDDAAETYERGEGSAVAKTLAECVRSLDPSRPIVINARERAPLKAELERAGIKSANIDGEKAAIGVAREKDLFGKLTENSFECADVAGYAYLYPRYQSDRNEYPDRLIIGSAAYPSRAFEAFEESEKNQNVIGEFLYCGADYLGYPAGKPEYENEQLKLLPPHASFCGDLDLTYGFKPSACYRSIMFGDRTRSCITASSPESKQKTDNLGHAVKETHSVWNWPHDLGKPIEIDVFSGGEVVALYRDGKLVGRKLAGKLNKHVASFKTDFYPGKLEAVSYHKGRECSRATLESVTAPRALKLTSERKSKSAGELIFVEIAINDKEGRLVSYASREVEISVTGSGRLYALGSADPESQEHTADNNIARAYNGKALAAILTEAGGDGKICVKAVSDGLLAGKINLRVKD